MNATPTNAAPGAGGAGSTAKATRKRINTYKATIKCRFLFEDDAQGAIEKRRKLEALAKELGGDEIEGSGAMGSTMIDVK